MIRAVVLILLLVIVSCYCGIFAYIGNLINADSKPSSIRSLSGSAIFPLILGAVTFGLRRLITKWLERPMSTEHFIEEGIRNEEIDEELIIHGRMPEDQVPLAP